MWEDVSNVIQNITPWEVVATDDAREIVRGAQRHCPEFPFDPVLVTTQQKTVPFYDDYSLVRFASLSDDKQSVPNQEIYGFYSEGDFRPLDATGRAIELLNNLAPLHLTFETLLEYTLLRLKIELPLLYSNIETISELRVAKIVSQFGELPIEQIDDTRRAELTSLLDVPKILMIPEWESLHEKYERGRVFRISASVVVYHAEDKFELIRVFAQVTPDGSLNLSKHNRSSGKLPSSKKELSEEHPVPQHCLCFPRYTRSALPIREWQTMEKKEFDACRELLANYNLGGNTDESDGKQVIPLLRKARLSFYRSYELLEVLEPWGDHYRRGYALIRMNGGKAAIRPLTGKSNVIHELNKEDSEFVFDEESAVDYLRFFCWSIHGEDGPFYIPQQGLRDLPFLSAPSEKDRTSLKELDFQIRPVADSDAPGLGYPKSEVPSIRLNAHVAYESAVFEAWFGIESSGFVTMVKDAPRVTNLDISNEIYGSGDLFELKEVAKSTPAPESIIEKLWWSRLSLVKKVLWLDYLKYLLRSWSELPDDQKVSSKDVPNAVKDVPQHIRTMMTQTPRMVASNRALRFVESMLVESSKEIQISPKSFLESLNIYLDAIRANKRAGPEYFLRSLIEHGEVAARQLEEPIVLNTAALKSDGHKEDKRNKNELNAAAIVIKDCWFQRAVRLTDLAESPGLTFVGCVFEEGLDASEGVIGRSLILIDCVLRNFSDVQVLSLGNARFKGNLQLIRCSLEGSIYAPRLQAENHVVLFECKIASSLSYISEPITVIQFMDKEWSDTQAQLQQRESLNPAIELGGAKIDGNWVINSNDVASSIYGGINHNNTQIDGDIWLRGLLCLGHVSFQSARVGGSITLDRCRTSTGRVSFVGATVDGSVRLTQVEIGDDLQFARAKVSELALQQTGINGAASLYRTTIEGNFHLEGVTIAGDLNLNFAQIFAYMVGRHTLGSEILSRKCLSVGGDLILSAAEIKAVELFGAEVKGRISIRTGVFGSLGLVLGIEKANYQPADGKDVRYVVNPCRAKAIEMSAITVSEELDISGLEVIQPADEAKRTKLRMRQRGIGLLITKSTIGRDLRFFIEDIRTSLERRYNTAEQIVNWDATPTPSDCAAKTWGKLILSENTIGGHLDLRNVFIADGLDLSDTRVDLDINIDAGDPDFERFKTKCLGFNAEKLECKGDLKLSGLEVIGDFRAPGAKVRGEILFLPRNRKERRECVFRHDIGNTDKQEPPHKYALITGTLDLTAITATHLMLSGENLNPGSWRRDSSPKNLQVWLLNKWKNVILVKKHLLKQTPGQTSLARVVLERGDIGRLEIVKPWLLGPANVAAITVRKWVFGDPREDGEEDQEANADNYIQVLGKMKPFDRSTWVEVENALRNEAQESEANKVFIAMRQNVRQKWWADYAQASGIWQSAKMLLRVLWDYAQFFVTRYGTKVWLPMIIVLALFIPTFLTFRNPHNVRATSGLHQILGSTGDETKKILEKRSNQGLAFELSPVDLDFDWTWRDALALTIRYQVPIIPGLTHQWWEAGGRLVCTPGVKICVGAEQYAFGVEIFHWVAWPLFLIGAAAQVFRGKRS